MAYVRIEKKTFDELLNLDRTITRDYNYLLWVVSFLFNAKLVYTCIYIYLRNKY